MQIEQYRAKLGLLSRQFREIGLPDGIGHGVTRHNRGGAGGKSTLIKFMIENLDHV
jgi:hypothetical protein